MTTQEILAAKFSENEIIHMFNSLSMDMLNDLPREEVIKRLTAAKPLLDEGAENLDFEKLNAAAKKMGYTFHPENYSPKNYTHVKYFKKNK